MATTAIADEIEAITGVGTADASFLVSAQKFVVSSVPKSLLRWAATFTVPGNHGGNASDGVKITMPVGTDSILDVSRNGFSGTEVPYSMKGFIANTASLHLATNTYPKYYLDDANPGEGVRIIVKPIPTDSATAVALYVDYSKIDDDCDLRNAVIYRAASSELGKLSGSVKSSIVEAFGFLVSALAQVETANDKWALDAGASIFGDEDTFTSASSQLTRVKDAVDKVSSLIEADKPASGYDAHDLLAAEDIELLNGNLSIVKSELERAQVHLAEWIAIGDMTAKQVSSNIAEAQGYANEVTARISQQQIFLTEANKYYQWANQELQTYIGTNEKAIKYQSQQQQTQAAAASQ